MSQTFTIPGVDSGARRAVGASIPIGWNPLNDFDKGTTTARSYLHYDQSITVSALYKSLNRGLSLEAIKWGLERYYTNKAVRISSWNTLLEYSLECIGPADPSAFLRVNYLKTNYHESVEAYITAILILAQANKTNLILFCNLLYPEFKQKGVGDRIYPNITPENIQYILDKALYEKNLTDIIYAIFALFSSEKQTQIKHYDSFNPVSLVYESFAKIYPTNQMSYITLLLNAAVQQNWLWEPKSIKIYLFLAHLHCSNSVPTITTIQQFPADNVGYLAKLFRERSPLLVWLGPTEYQVDLSTDDGRKDKASKEQWIKNMSILVNEDKNWAPLSEKYRLEVSLKKSKKLDKHN
jgi:hypothetical protein